MVSRLVKHEPETSSSPTFSDVYRNEGVHPGFLDVFPEVLVAPLVLVAGTVEARAVGRLALPFLVVGPVEQELTRNTRTLACQIR